MKITIQDGKGKPINPYHPNKDLEENEMRKDFNKDNSPLIVLDQNGLEYKEPGTYEAEKVWLIMPNYEFKKNYPKGVYRPVYILTPNPTLEGKEEEEEKQKRNPIMERLRAKITDEDKALIDESFAIIDRIHEEKQKTITLEEAENIWASHEYGEIFLGGSAIVAARSFYEGSQWQAKNSDLINKDVVIEVLKFMCGYTDFPEKQQGESNFYWRTILRKKFAEIGIEINNP